MAAAVQDLLANHALALTLLTPAEALPPGALEAAVVWVHSSDLRDPTPFLEQGHVLLITGSQFSVDAGSEAFADACTAAGLPLFEVPYRIPFIAIAQYAAGLVAEEANARRNWALSAQRAISLAALKPNGLTATLVEASRQLDRWVVLVDASGGIDRLPQATPHPAVPAAGREHAPDLPG